MIIQGRKSSEIPQQLYRKINNMETRNQALQTGRCFQQKYHKFRKNVNKNKAQCQY